MLPWLPYCRSFVIIILLSVAGCAHEQSTPLSVPAETTPAKLTAIPQPPPDCPDAARVTYNRLEEIFSPVELNMSASQLKAIDRQILSALGHPRYSKRNQDSITTYEWLSPDCPGWYIHASFNPNSYSIHTAEIPPPIVTFPSQDTTSGLRYTLVGHPREVETVILTPDGQTVISGSADGQIHFWQLSDGAHLRQFKAKDWVNRLRVSRDGKTLMSLGSDLTTWEIATGTLMKQWEFTNGGSIHNFFSPDQRFIVSEINDEQVNLWSIESQKRVASFTSNHRIGTIALHPNGRILADVQNLALGANQNPIILWDITSGKQLQQLSGHSYLVSAALFSPDGAILATGSEAVTLGQSQESVVKLWNWQKKILVRTLAGQAGGIRSMVFSTDGQRLATGSGNGTIAIWNTQTGQQLQTLTGHTDAVIALAFDQTGDRLISGSDDRTVRIWQLE